MENIYELLYMSRLCDEYAYRRLLKIFEPAVGAIVKGYLSRFSSYHLSREDLFQEGRLALGQAIETYRSDRGAGFRTFAEVVIRRRIVSCIRAAVHKQEYDSKLGLDDMVAENIHVYDCVPAEKGLGDPEYYLAYTCAEENLYRAIGKLNQKEQHVLAEWMRGSSYKEAAKRLGVSSKSYDSRLQRLRQKVKKSLCEDDN